MDQIKGAGGLPVLFLMKCLLFSYILTGALLALLALILYKAGLDEKVVAVAMIVIYVGATFFAGFMAGKKMGGSAMNYVVAADGLAEEQVSRLATVLLEEYEVTVLDKEDAVSYLRVM